jgi:ATP-binding cassette subfamily C protein LapB
VRQGIAVIRALVGNPPIILFDEANVALDGDSDEKLRQLLVTYKGRRTMVLVSYRPSILKLADRVLKIEGGRLVAVARPEQLQPAPAPAQPQKAVA